MLQPLSRFQPLLLFLCLAALEFALFDQWGAKHHTWVYPRWNDQVQYLTESYLGYEDAKARGVMPALWSALTNKSAQGTLHDVAAIAVFSLAGPSRSAALSLNMLAFLAFQLALFLWVKRETRSPWLAFIAAAGLLMITSPWKPRPGCAYDFRLDWFAVCAMGVALVACLNTSRFLRTPASLLFGLSVGVALLTRFLTGAYFAVIFLVLAIDCLCAHDRWRRLLNLLLAGFVATLIAGPIFWLNRETIYTYYVWGHFIGPESGLRSSHLGFMSSSAWIWSRVWIHHVGAPFVCFIAGTLLASSVSLLLAPKNPRESGFDFVVKPVHLLPPIAFALCPALVLTLHFQKTDQVLGVVVPGVVVFLILVALHGLRAASSVAQARTAFAALAAALGVFVARMADNPHSQAFIDQARLTLHISDYIAKRSAATGLSAPRVAVDRVTDSLDAQVLRVTCYERHHRWIPFIMTLPTGLSREDPNLFWERLQHSDFVFLTEEGDEGHWPFDHQMSSMRIETLAWAADHLRRVHDIPLPGLRMVLFERQDLH